MPIFIVQITANVSKQRVSSSRRENCDLLNARASDYKVHFDLYTRLISDSVVTLEKFSTEKNSRHFFEIVYVCA